MQIPVKTFTTKYNGIARVLWNEVYIAQVISFSSAPESQSPEKSGAKKFNAIWDTGATNTVITQKVVSDCGLKPIGMTKVQTAKGESISPVYFASIFLPNKVVIPQLRVTEGIIAGDAEVLIGMDIISHGDFAVTNKDGKTIFSFRLPSIERIDFVEQAQSVATPQISKPSPKVGRNDPCPCGSGKKYKKCCGK